MAAQPAAFSKLWGWGCWEKRDGVLQRRCLAVFSASECSWTAGKGRCPDASVPPEGFYLGPAGERGSEISKEGKPGLSKEKGVALKELI